MSARLERLRAALRWRQLQRWIDLARALGRDDIADVLAAEQLDAVQSAEATTALVRAARAACVLELFELGADEDEDEESTPSACA